MINNENVTTYVSIHNGYDGKGRLVTTGGTTTVITSPKQKIKPIKIGHKVNIIA
jgi:bifunctional N-acetylglucosamine-1-phosphate-uridyltransferase/glucosamine-1-phosphate-acetyltransferase GlmU-like protein